MQVDQISPHITVTGRHLSITPAINDYAVKKVEGLHLAYPKIIEAHVILEVNKYRHVAEVVLNCCNHITIEAREISHDLYASIDTVMAKIARRMRKYKTRLLRSHRPRKENSIRFLDSQVIPANVFETFDELDKLMGSYQKKGGRKGKKSDKKSLNGDAHADGHSNGSEPNESLNGHAIKSSHSENNGATLSQISGVRAEPYPVKPMFVEEALLQLEVSKSQFLLFFNAQSDQLNVIYRHKTGDFGLIQPDFNV